MLTSKLISFFLMTFFLFSCDDHEKRETKFFNGQIEEKFAVIKTTEGNFIKDGEYNKFFLSGSPEVNGMYDNGKKVGSWTFLFDNGQTKLAHNYVNDTLDGDFHEWYRNGLQAADGKYERGKQIGKWVTWYDNGKKQTEGTYASGGKKDGSYTVWRNDGTLFMKRVYQNGIDINLPTTYNNETLGSLTLNPDNTYK